MPKKIAQEPNLHGKLSAAQRRKLDRMIDDLQKLAEAGVVVIEKWSISHEVPDPDRQIIAAMGAALFASYISAQSDLAAKRAAITASLLAAYNYGKHGNTSDNNTAAEGRSGLAAGEDTDGQPAL